MSASPLDPPTIENFLIREYGLSGAPSPLPGENENYQIVTPKGKRYVLKVTPPGYSREFVELEIAATEAVSLAIPTLDLPRMVLSSTGAKAVKFPGPGSANRGFARLFEFVGGAGWSEASNYRIDDYAQVGRVVAQISLALAPLDLPGAHRTHRWDVANAGQHWSNTHLISDTRRRRLAGRAFMLWSASARPHLDGLPHQLIHGDLNDENLRVSDGRLTGLLDFGDLLYNPAICDLAIALTYTLFDQEDPLSMGAWVVGGYHEIRSLTTPELEVLFPLICGRLAISVAVAAERRTIDPGRTAWYVTEERAWRALENLLQTDPVEAADRLASRTGVPVFAESGGSPAELLARRREHFSTALSLAYEEPAKFNRGRGQYLIDHRGQPYLDLYNNVPHVGHCHPRVVDAAHRQMRRLNTNTRYLYDELYEYADRLCATFPEPLSVCFFVNSGTEANELALRLAGAYTGRQDVLVLDHAYHGHTGRLIEISPYKFNGPGGSGRSAPWVHVLPIPDGYRGIYKGQGPETGLAYSGQVRETIRSLDRPISAMIAETLPSCAGQIIPPDGYFEGAFEHVRQAGGLCILDEVQVGFGRVGTHFWAFELYGVVPDIVVMGKPMGNGHPLGAVVTRRDIADSFAGTGMEFFSTFGGNPVSCAVGIAVLDVIREEGLQEKALAVGSRLLEGLKSLKDRYPVIGDVRGAGLFIGIELVRDRSTLEPASEETASLVNGVRRRNILTGIDGPYYNVIKIKPPLVVNHDDVSFALEVFDEVLSEITPV